MVKTIRSNEDTLAMLDSFFPNEAERWNNFFASLPATHPLSSELPDENLVSLIGSGKIIPGTVFDIGCGNGRNAIYMAKNGFRVDAIDLSKEVIEKAAQFASGKQAQVNF